MDYRARLPAAFEAAELTHGQRELARWAALSLARRIRIIVYLSRRLVRLARRQAWIAIYRLGWEASVYARAAGLDLRRFWRWLRSDGPRRLWRELLQDLRDLAPDLSHWAAIGVAWVALVTLPTLAAPQGERDHARRSVREAAIEARRHAPPPCSLTDGQVWVLDNGRFVRPRDADYLERREALCGF